MTRVERALLLTAAGEERVSWRGVPVKAAAEATKAKRRAKTVFMVMVLFTNSLTVALETRLVAGAWPSAPA